MKQRLVVAVLVRGVRVLSVGTNEHDCKRVGMPTGVGYELCEGCDYANHAEVKAIEKATAELGSDVSGAKLYLFGHTYACEPCKAKARAYRVEIILTSG